MTHRILRSLLIGVLALSVSSCAHVPAAPLRIDGSTPESFDMSWKRMYDRLSPEQQTQLNVAILPIALGRYKSFAEMPPSARASIKPADVRAQIDGMTFQEILALAQKQSFKVTRGPSQRT